MHAGCSWQGLSMSDATRCRVCGRELTKDEIAVTKKLICRGAVSFLCVSCLAEHFQVEPEEIRERIAYFKSMGCTLFEK